jgi:hypothetical protein
VKALRRFCHTDQERVELLLAPDEAEAVCDWLAGLPMGDLPGSVPCALRSALYPLTERAHLLPQAAVS